VFVDEQNKVNEKRFGTLFQTVLTLAENCQNNNSKTDGGIMGHSWRQNSYEISSFRLNMLPAVS